MTPGSGYGNLESPNYELLSASTPNDAPCTTDALQRKQSGGGTSSAKGGDSARYDLDAQTGCGQLAVPTDAPTCQPRTRHDCPGGRHVGELIMGGTHTRSSPQGDALDDASGDACQPGSARPYQPASQTPFGSSPSGGGGGPYCARLAAARDQAGPRKMGCRDGQKAEEQAREQARETARLAAEQSRREAEEAKAIQAQLQQQLQALATVDAEAAQAFAKKRETLARESQAIAMRLQILQSTVSNTSASFMAAGQLPEKATLPPHLLATTNYHTSTPATFIPTHGPAEASNNACGPAEPYNHAHQALAVPQQTASPSGTPRPEEVRKEPALLYPVPDQEATPRTP